MKIVQFDGTDVWYEHLEPKWSVDDVMLRHEERVRDALLNAGLPMEWDDGKMVYDFLTDSWVNRPGVTPETAGPGFEALPVEVTEWIGWQNCHDFRERNGWRRVDGKPLQNRVRKVALDKLADELGVETHAAGWEELTIETLKSQPAKGRVSVTC